MIIDKTKPEEQSFALPKIELVIPDAHKQQLQQAIITLVTVLLSIVLTLSAQVVSQAIGGPDVPTDPMIALGTTHFADLAVTGDVAAGGDITAGGTLTIDGITFTVTGPITVSDLVTAGYVLVYQPE